MQGPDGLGQRDIFAGELGLQGQRMGGNDDPAVRLGVFERGQQVGQRLADPGSGFNQSNAAGRRHSGVNRRCDRLLLRAGNKARQGAFQGAIFAQILLQISASSHK